MLRAGQRPYFGFYMNDAVADRPVPRDGAFHHVVFQYTGDAKEIWVDGRRVLRRHSRPYLGTRGATRIGKSPGWNNVAASHFVGAMKDLRIYDRALSAAEIARLGGK